MAATTIWSMASAIGARASSYDVVTGLWDSFADDAFICEARRPVLRSAADARARPQGRVSVRQGPAQHCPSDPGLARHHPGRILGAGRQLAAETAEAVFTAPLRFRTAAAFMADVKARAAAAGRDPAHIKILPAAFVVLGDTLEDAQAIRARLDSLVHYESAIASLSIALGHDASGFDPGRPAAAHARDQPEQERARARHRTRRA